MSVFKFSQTIMEATLVTKRTATTIDHIFVNCEFYHSAVVISALSDYQAQEVSVS